MSDGGALAPDGDDLLALLDGVVRLLGATPNADGHRDVAEGMRVLASVEHATPGGAPLHAQLDTVRKWLTVLQRPGDHERLGGTAHVRDFVLIQLRLARGALEDYLRETR